MTTQSSNLPSRWVPLKIPFLNWMKHYDRDQFTGDVIAGIVVAVMLVPQSMAYAMLAGLPPQIGLYASIAPLIVYGLLGSSRVLAVGPVALVSLLTATSVSQLADPGTADYISLALTLALMTAVMQAGLGLLRMGFIVNFLSHPVLSGFTSAVALIIGFSQLKHLLGFNIPRSDQVWYTAWYGLTHVSQTNLITLTLGAGSIALMLYFKNGLGGYLSRFNLPEGVITSITRLGPLAAVLIGTVIVWLLRLDQSAAVAVVGNVPRGLPGFSLPKFDLYTLWVLHPAAVTITLVGYMESISIAKSLASKRRQNVDANQELIALGAANFAASLTGGYPVAGGLGRSVVNYSAGARTGLASIITAVLIALTVLFFTPLFYYLPQALLAAIIVVAVSTLFDWKTFAHSWAYNRIDALALLITFFGVLTIGVEYGILVGALSAVFLYLWKTSHPVIKMLGNVPGTEQFKNVENYETITDPHILIVRVDESLYFPNAHFIEEFILERVTSQPEIEHVILVGSAVNQVDASALHTLEGLAERLKSSGIGFYLADFKMYILRKMEEAGFYKVLPKEHIFFSTHQAFESIRA